jgi:hypothetical protein
MSEEQDLARVVRDKAVERLGRGELKPTLRDGLAAQSLLDRREEKQKDRNFMLSLARLMSGSESETPDAVVIDVTPALTSGDDDDLGR